MGERNILSYFPSFDSANRVKEELHNIGFEIVQVDRLGRMPQDGLNNPLTGQISSLTNLTLGTSMFDDAAILLATDPDVSGLASEDIPGRFPFIVTVVADAARAEQALQVIRKHGGYV